MLTKQAIRETSKRRMWAVLPVVTCAIVAAILYFIGVGQFREVLIAFSVDRFGEIAGDITPLVLILPVFLIFLVSSIAAEKYAGRFKTICPSCDCDISVQSQQLLATRCCPSCDQQIVDGGRIRSATVYKRYLAIRWRSFLQYLFWAFPGFGLVIIIWRLFDRSAFQQCPQCLWVIPLIGTSSAGWAWLRTFDRRYVLPLLASAILLGVGATIFWYA